MASMAEMKGPAGGPSTQELEERWKEAVDALTESPRDVELLLKAGQLSEQLGRRPETYNYYRKALLLDPTKSFLVSKLRPLAVTPEQKEELNKFSRLPASFQACLGDVFRYPVRGKGLAILLLGALFLWVGRGLMGGGIGMSGMTIAGFVAAYMAMFYIDVCHTTIGGEDHLPEWPDPLRVSEFFSDIAKFFVAKIVSFLPVIVIVLVFGVGGFSKAAHDEIPDFQMEYARRPPPPGPDGQPPPPTRAPAPVRPPASSRLLWGLVGSALAALAFVPVGMIYLPMAILSNVVMGSPWTCLNVPFVARSIVAAPKDYLICLALYFGTFLLTGGAELAARLVGIVPTGLALGFLELYAMTVLMRLMGQFYRMNQARLGWMAD
jgi:hypothetical protein